MNLLWGKKKKSVVDSKEVQIKHTNFFKKIGCKGKGERNSVTKMLACSGGWKMEEGFEHVCKFQKWNQQRKRNFSYRGDDWWSQLQRDGKQWGWAHRQREELWMLSENVGRQVWKGSWRGELRHREARIWEHSYLMVPYIIRTHPSWCVLCTTSESGERHN